MQMDAVQVATSFALTVLVPGAMALWVRSIVDTAIAKADDRFNKFELKVTEAMGDSKAHLKESEMRHSANETRINFLEQQWTALQTRTDQQQRFQHEIVETQKGITSVLGQISETLRHTGN